MLLAQLTGRSSRRRRPLWLRSRTIVGLGIAQRTTAGRRLGGDRTLKVYVRDKLPANRLAHPVRALSVRGIKVEPDVEAVGEFFLDAFSGRFRPARPGCSIGHLSGSFGTFGGIVRQRASGDMCILSCAHVLAPLGSSSLGDVVYQPAPGDGGGVADQLGRLAGWTPLREGGGFPNSSDAAVAKVVDEARVRADFLRLGFAPGAAALAKEDDAVRRVGRTTELVEGVVLDTNFSVRVTHTAPSGTKRFGFHAQVLCEMQSEPGDSGALVVNANGNAVGLHIASSNARSVFTPIHTILADLDVDVA